MIIGVIPCAGSSERMGRPKALLDFNGRTFVQAAVDVMAGGGCHEVIVVVPNDRRLQEAAVATGARVSINEDPGEGPITSLRLAINEIPAEALGVAYLPVDHPAVNASSVAAVLAAAVGGAHLVVPMLGHKRGHPAFFGRSLFAELLDPSLEGGARTVVHRHLHAAALVQLDDEGIRTDVDTPEEYAILNDTATS